MKKFNPLSPTSKISICGLPLRMDTYRTCSFGCRYCFSNGRTVMPTTEELQVANLKWLKEKLDKILVLKKYDNTNLLDSLIYNNYTFHCGGMADPFQPCEKELLITKKAIDICNDYDRHILFSTKTDSTYEANINPTLHTFQLSVTNIDNRKDIEPNVPDIESRYQMFYNLKSKGFKVGIRIQPFIPNISTLGILEKFKEADHFTLEGLKIVTGNEEQKDFIFNILGLNRKEFFSMGLLIQRPKIRYELYKPFIEYFEANKMSYSIADNDLHWMGNNTCCCGDALVSKATTFNSTYLSHIYNNKYDSIAIDTELNNSNLSQCKFASYIHSSERHGNITIQDFFDYGKTKKKNKYNSSYFWFPNE